MQENYAEEKPPKHFLEKLTKQVGEETRNNVAYLYQSIHKPVVRFTGRKSNVPGNFII